MARKLPIYDYPRGAWYVFAYRLSDPVHLGFIKDHYQNRLNQIETDLTLTTSEKQQALNQLFEDQVLTMNWYAWDNCDRSRFFATQEEAIAYMRECKSNNSFSPLFSVMSPEDFERAMASPETDTRVHLLKKYLLELRDGPEPEYRVV
jgi:hypothetical protein